ncbi:hypothetical protein NXC14_CH02763 [Rhizobium sp. NXC14]|nr:hypothetical protein NXC14_CH02763 [Rhizobium sp. NXC14]
MKSRLRSCSPQPKTAKKVTIRQPAAGRAATRPASINILHFFHPRRCRQADEGVSDERSECAERKRRAMNGVPCAPHPTLRAPFSPLGRRGSKRRLCAGTSSLSGQKASRRGQPRHPPFSS